MKFTSIILLLLVYTFNITAQSKPVNIAKKYATGTYFPGGIDSLKKYLNRKIQYFDFPENVSIDKRLLIKFRISEKGIPEDFSFTNKIGYGFEEEVEKALKTIPLWKPASINGEPIKSDYVIIPIYVQK